MPESLVPGTPQTWKVTTLGELCASGGGNIQTGPFGSQLHAADYVTQGIPSVMPQNIGDNVIKEEGIARIAPEDAFRLEKYLLAPGDIVYSRRGDIEKRALVRETQRGWLCGTGCLRVRPGVGANSEFISYYLGHPSVREWIVKHAVGATMPNLNTKILSSLPVSVPPLNEQVSIASTLGALDNKITVNKQIVSTYESLLATEFEQLIRIEAGAEQDIALANEFVEFNPKYQKPSDPTSRHVNMAALPTSSARVHTWDFRKPTPGTRFQNGDTLLARITPCLENGKTAFVDFMDDNETGIGSTEFIVMRSLPGVPQHFSYLLARNKRFREHAISNMIGTSGRQRCPADRLPGFSMKRPDPTELERIGKDSDVAFAHMRSLDSEAYILAELRDTLLPKLISGELRVKDAEKRVSDAV
ncbi:restriction endonuclease subunit S [Nocardiopsis dassonvillei]|uniref:Restriction modification system DNA specificity domain protein n=1 Tax=Nocardiopsis dassonvillei (strain ATCC 23218 / DSM 43111 / CIP 107115 / JCM 7437 / KCTC 9190 / NBRC 14626 / NCTC 10488 / NRRL B-5397 / IMRU 509) TaxID=446468 RepID=D7B1R4_NOCDD|nr:restriction endonuclease subunit S [Nocardiopsis dassonvillei]ADH68490.1 restriction modification system DNA specificity domain protein [Nocardiopsis dassonvillei subsp. dassonvillei DSM 43111]NKY80160.1 restriction endonuclease subunit S [Nocardiopsis dassonvillei]VEI88998.1 EcoKI restriction-modification system protein HsdS [Nocardiopsis dassonvillei]